MLRVNQLLEILAEVRDELFAWVRSKVSLGAKKGPLLGKGRSGITSRDVGFTDLVDCNDGDRKSCGVKSD